MALNRDKRNAGIMIATFLAVVTFLQMTGYGRVTHGPSPSSGRAGRWPLKGTPIPEGRACISHICVFFDVTFSGHFAGRIIFRGPVLHGSSGARSGARVVWSSRRSLSVDGAFATLHLGGPGDGREEGGRSGEQRGRRHRFLQVLGGLLAMRWRAASCMPAVASAGPW